MRRITPVLAAIAMTTAALLAPVSPASAAPACTGTGCDGLDPSAVGTSCNSQAVTVATVPFRHPASGALTAWPVHLRYSISCRAAWANTGGFELAGVTASIVIERGTVANNTFYVGRTITEPLVVGRGAYTRMLGTTSATHVRACVTSRFVPTGATRTACSAPWQP